MYFTEHAKMRMKTQNIPAKYIPLIKKVGTRKPAKCGGIVYETINFGTVIAGTAVVTAWHNKEGEN